MKVETDVRSMLFEELMKIITKPIEAAVVLVTPKWRNTITTKSMMNLKNQKTENWSHSVRAHLQLVQKCP